MPLGAAAKRRRGNDIAPGLLTRASLRRAAKAAKRMRRGFFTAAASITTVGLAAGAIAMAPTAMAVSGVGPGVDGRYGHVGALHQPGVGQVYCLDSSLEVPFGRGLTADYVTSYLPAWPGVAGAINVGADSLGRMNFILSTWGQTGDAAHAAAAHTAATAYTKSGGFDSAASYLGGNQGVIDLAWSMFIQSTQIAVGGGSGSGSLAFTVDHRNNYTGTVRMEGTQATGYIELVNGVFQSTGTSRLNGAQTGVEYAITGVPPTADGAIYKISGSGEFTGGQSWPGHLRVLEYGGGYQRTGVGVGPVTTKFRVEGSDPQSRSQVFQPVLTSKTASITPDGVLSDTLTFDIAPNAVGTQNVWKQNAAGEYAPVGFKVTAYATGSDKPIEVPDVPAAANAVGSATVLATGPGTSATVTIPGVHPQGYYTFVAEYDPTITPLVTRYFLPQNYAWKHAFGMEEETTVVPMDVNINTQILSDIVAPGTRGDDSVTVSTEGDWLNIAGRPATVVAYGEYIYLPAELGEIEPSQQLPAGAQVRGTALLSYSGPGTQETTGLEVLTGDITAPQVADGSMTWRWSVRTEDQSAAVAGLVNTFQERVGVPEQTQRIMPPMDVKINTEILSDIVAPGTRGDDSVTVSTEGEWLNIDGQPATVVAYGEYIYLPAELGKIKPSVELPEGAEVRGTALLSYSGPGTQETTGLEVLTGDITAPQVADGSMTWRWSVRTEDQSAAVAGFVKAFQERVGLPEQTQRIVPPMDVKINTEILSDIVAPGARGDDSVTVSTEGEWVSIQGEPVTVVAFGEYIYLPAELGEIEPSQELPEGAEVRATVLLPYTGPGMQDSTDVKVLTGDITAPQVIDGSMTWRWSVRTEDQSAAVAGFVKAFQERVGLPEQTQKIAMPTITTKAQTGMPWGGDAIDTAIVEGPMPEKGLVTVHFEAYKAPLNATDLSEVCTTENRIELDDTPIEVPEPGEYDSPAVKNVEFKIAWTEVGTYTPEGGEPVEFTRGKCGIENEITTPLPKPTPPGLASTGSDAPVGPLVIGGGAVLLGLIALGVTALVRRRRESVEP